MGDVPYITYMALYMLSFQIIQSNSRTSTVWKLNNEEGKIVESSSFPRVVSLPGLNNEHVTDTDYDQIFDIITSTIHFGQSWAKHSMDPYCSDCPQFSLDDGGKILANGSNDERGATSNKYTNNWGSNGRVSQSDSSNQVSLDTEDHLDCGKSVNFTYYDNLVGIANRHNHPNVPEPQVAMIFKKRSTKGTEFDVGVLEKRLKKAKREKPKSVQLYNQIGNFWRIKGDAQKSIECFRRALAVSPHNAEVLLNLARVLYNLQYLDDAIYLTRRSLEVQPPDKNAWQQYFTLGEIFKAYGHYQEAVLHLRHTLELKPDFQPAIAALKEMESLPDATIHIYTLLIIVCLVLGVLLVILSSVEGSLEEEYKNALKQRHFNRSIAMRSLKLGISPRSVRMKRHYGGGLNG